MKSFKFNLDAKVKLISSDEQGIICGRAEYSMDENQYWVIYKDGTGCQRKCWWQESEISLVG
jgi:hypothetical protein